MLKLADFPRKLCGRTFNSDDLALISRIITENPSALRQEISRKVCLAFDWFKPDGGLKDMSCRVAMLKLHRSGLIELPPPIHGNVNGRRRIQLTPRGEPQKPIVKPVRDLLPLELRRVVSKEDSYFWNELIDRYHYLDYGNLQGAQIRYLVNSSEGWLGALSFSGAAWKVKPRDLWIGWTHENRIEKLHLLVNNTRFLILPWVNSKNLASKILSLCVKKLPQDWQDVYNYKPVLLETFVERDRFAGTCYKAANWVFVGCTQGRGKMDRFSERKLPVKDIYLYPLTRNFREILV